MALQQKEPTQVLDFYKVTFHGVHFFLMMQGSTAHLQNMTFKKNSSEITEIPTFHGDERGKTSFSQAVTKGLGKEILTQTKSPIPNSKVKWSAPKMDSLRVKANLILKG